MPVALPEADVGARGVGDRHIGATLTNVPGAVVYGWLGHQLFETTAPDVGQGGADVPVADPSAPTSASGRATGTSAPP